MRDYHTTAGPGHARAFAFGEHFGTASGTAYQQCHTIHGGLRGNARNRDGTDKGCERAYIT